jgi:predicted nucleic acid binding AN1-type Zn finger protein
MPFCKTCNVEIDGSNLYQCKYCGENYCADHRLPPNHNCSGIDAWKGKVPPEGVRWVSYKKEEPTIEIFFCKYCSEPLQRNQLFLCNFCLDSFCSEHKEPKAHACKEYVDSTPIAGDIPTKSVCDYCEKYVEASQLFKCRYCGMNFCPDHRLPPNHSCIGIKSWGIRGFPSTIEQHQKSKSKLLKWLRGMKKKF